MAYNTKNVEIVILNTGYIQHIDRFQIEKWDEIDFSEYDLNKIEIMLLIYHDKYSNLTPCRIFLPTNDEYENIIRSIKIKLQTTLPDGRSCNYYKDKRDVCETYGDTMNEIINENVDNKFPSSLIQKREILLDILNHYTDEFCAEENYPFYNDSIIIHLKNRGEVYIAFEILTLLNKIDYYPVTHTSYINNFELSKDGRIFVINFDGDEKFLK